MDTAAALTLAGAAGFAQLFWPFPLFSDPAAGFEFELEHVSMTTEISAIIPDNR